MTEHEYYRDPEAPAPDRRDVYREREVDGIGAPADDATRDIYEQRVYNGADEQVVQSERVSVPSDAARRAALVDRASQVIYFIFGAISVLLALRFVLLALGANELSPFVNFIYGLSRPFVLPFQGIFGEPQLGGSLIEWSSLVAIVIYSLIAYGLVRLVELVFAPTQ